MLITTLRRSVLTLAASAALLGASVAHAQQGSEASIALSGLPFASAALSAEGLSTSGSEGLSEAALSTVLVGGSLVVESVEASADAVTYIIKNVAKGTSVVVKVSATGAGALSVAAGTAVEASTFAAGTILSAAGKVIAYIPNQVGKALLHNERVN